MGGILQIKSTAASIAYAGEVKDQRFTCWMKDNQQLFHLATTSLTKQGCLFKMTLTFHSEKPSGSECCESVAMVLWISEHHLTWCRTLFISKQALETWMKPLTWKKIQGTTTTNQTGDRWVRGSSFCHFFRQTEKNWQNYTENLIRLLLRLRFKWNTSRCLSSYKPFQSISMGCSQVIPHTEMQRRKVTDIINIS